MIGPGIWQPKRRSMSSTLQYTHTRTHTHTQREACWPLLWVPLLYTVHTLHCTQQCAAMETAKSKVQPSLHLKHSGKLYQLSRSKDLVLLNCFGEIPCHQSLLMQNHLNVVWWRHFRKKLLLAPNMHAWIGAYQCRMLTHNLPDFDHEHIYIQNTTLVPGSILNTICRCQIQQ